MVDDGACVVMLLVWLLVLVVVVVVPQLPCVCGGDVGVVGVGVAVVAGVVVGWW